MKRQIILTNHALKRINERGLTPKYIRTIWLEAIEVRYPWSKQVHLAMKHGFQPKRYFWAAGILFVIEHEGSDQSGTGKYILITLYPKDIAELNPKEQEAR